MSRRFVVIAWIACSVFSAHSRAQVPVRISGLDRLPGVSVSVHAESVEVRWPTGRRDGAGTALLVLDRRPSAPLIRALALVSKRDGRPRVVARKLEPVWFLTEGSRRTPPGKPPWQKWLVFFDNPARRPHRTYPVRVQLDRIELHGEPGRLRITCGTASAGSFQGRRQLVIYPNCDLLHCVVPLQTTQDLRAILYDAGLVDHGQCWNRYAWIGLDDQLHQRPTAEGRSAGPLRVRYRAIAAASAAGSVACFPPPHQYQFPRDWTDNLGFVWAGSELHQQELGPGMGVRQAKTGGGGWVPWFNAPPGKEHRLSFFVTWSTGTASRTLRYVRRYTHDDQFVRLPGYLTFTSHYHMAVAVTAMERAAAGKPPLSPPEFVDVFKRMGVRMVHLAEFHGDGHQKDGGELRLRELQWMFRECRRLSDDELLLIPGEEVNTFLGLPPKPSRHPGHWMSLFPRPVYWIMQRRKSQPFVTEHPVYGTVYRVGSTEDMMRLVEAEKGLVWTAHPRIKASSWTPDVFRDRPWFLADYWLGAAWKAMPADLSEDRLGVRALELLDDMSNWGVRKYLLGEVDVFKIDRTHELYSHMNVNYLRMARLPSFDHGWADVLRVLRSGAFFVTTGEVLIPEFRVGDAGPGETLLVSGGRAQVRCRLQWTFPLRQVVLFAGDGRRVRRYRVPQVPEGAFGTAELALDLDLSGMRWVRLEAWDVAVNGAFTQPVWLSGR